MPSEADCQLQQHQKGGGKAAAAFQQPAGPDAAAEAQSERQLATDADVYDHQLVIDADVYDRRLREQDMTIDLKKRIAVVLGDRDISNGKCTAAV